MSVFSVVGCVIVPWLAAAGTFVVGFAISQANTLGRPLALTALPFVLGIGLCYLAPETKAKVLPE